MSEYNLDAIRLRMHDLVFMAKVMSPEPIVSPGIPAITLYVMCQHCAHFVDVDEQGPDDTWPDDNVRQSLAVYTHLDNGEKEHDHDAEPSTLMATLDQWKRIRPDLFVTYGDGMIGPNSTRR